MLITGTRTHREGNIFDAFIPIANMSLRIDDSLNYAQHIADLIMFSIEHKTKKVVPVIVEYVNEFTFGLTVEVCPEITSYLMLELRMNHSLTQYALAKKMGAKSNNNLSRFESGDRIPTLESLDRIADALGYNLEISLRKKEENNIINKKAS